MQVYTQIIMSSGYYYYGNSAFQPVIRKTKVQDNDEFLLYIAMRSQEIGTFILMDTKRVLKQHIMTPLLYLAVALLWTKRHQYLQRKLVLFMQRFNNHFFFLIITDTLSVLSCLENHKIYNNVYITKIRDRLPETKDQQLEFIWVPSHSGITPMEMKL